MEFKLYSKRETNCVGVNGNEASDFTARCDQKGWRSRWFQTKEFTLKTGLKIQASWGRSGIYIVRGCENFGSL